MGAGQLMHNARRRIITMQNEITELRNQVRTLKRIVCFVCCSYLLSIASGCSSMRCENCRFINPENPCNRCTQDIHNLGNPNHNDPGRPVDDGDWTPTSLGEPSGDSDRTLAEPQSNECEKVGLVIIRGNSLTEDHVIRGRINLFPGHDLDVAELERSKIRLLNTPFIKNVRITIQPENPNNPGFRDVLVEVREMGTNSIDFGLMVGSDSGIIFNFNINLPTEISPNRTAEEILDAINTRVVDQQSNRPLLSLERAWIAVSQIRTKLLHEEINRDELRKRIDEMIGWIMSADDPANLERRFAAAKPLKRDFDAERLVLLGVAIALAEAVNDVALAKKSLNFSFVIMNNSDSKQQKYLLPPLIAGWLKPVHPIKDSTVCDEVFADVQSWLVNESELFQPEHLPWLDYAHVYLLSLRDLPNDAIAALPSLKSSVPDEPLFLLLQQTDFWKYHRPNPYTSQLSQRWVFNTIHAFLYSLATEAKEKEQLRELLVLQFEEFPIELSDDLLSSLKKLKLPPISNFDKMQSDVPMEYKGAFVLLQEIKTRVMEDKITDVRSLIDLVLSEEFQSMVAKQLESLNAEGKP